MEVTRSVRSAPPFPLLLAEDGHLLGGLVSRHVCLVANHDHCLVGRTSLDDRALLVRAADNVKLGRERRSGCADQKGEGQHVLEHFVFSLVRTSTEQRAGKSRVPLTRALCLL